MDYKKSISTFEMKKYANWNSYGVYASILRMQGAKLHFLKASLSQFLSQARVMQHPSCNKIKQAPRDTTKQLGTVDTGVW